MTPTTSERDRFEAWAKDTMSLVKEPGGYKEATTHHAWRAWQAALARVQREVPPGLYDLDPYVLPQQEAPSEQREGVCPKCNGAGGERWHEADGSENGQRCEACDGFGTQQEAPGAVACWRLVSRFGVCSVWLTGDISADAARQAIADGNRVERAYTTPPAPVDVRKPMSRFIELLAQLVNAPQTDDEFDAEVLRREVVMEKVMQLRAVWDDLSKAHRALLDGQPAWVCVYPDCNCPFDAPADPNWCARGLPKAALGGGGRG